MNLDTKTKVLFILNVIGNLVERTNVKVNLRPNAWKIDVELVAKSLENHAKELRRLINEE